METTRGQAGNKDKVQLTFAWASLSQLVYGPIQGVGVPDCRLCTT